MKIFSRIGAAVARLRLSHQLFSAFAVLLLITGLIGAASIFGLARVNRAAGDLADFVPGGGTFYPIEVFRIGHRSCRGRFFGK